MRTVIVTNGASTPSGDKRWRWETRDNDGHLLEAGEWCTNPAAPTRQRLTIELARAKPLPRI